MKEVEIMTITTNKVNSAILKMECATGDVYELRTDACDGRCKKYTLYAIAVDGFAVSGLYGKFVETFRTQKEFCEWVNERY